MILQLDLFCQNQGKDSGFPYVQSFMALSQNLDLRGLRCMCLSVAFLFHSPLLPSPSDFLDDPCSTFPIHIWYLLLETRKGFWVSLWSRSFSYIQKPEGSKTLLNILENSLLTTPVSQGGEGPSFLSYPCKFPYSFRFFWLNKTPLLPDRQSKNFISWSAPDMRVNLSIIWSIF